MTFQLGVDTGGTYTDAVLLDGNGQVVAKNKSLTTAHDLTLGIGNAISSLPSNLLASVNLVSLSTTLSTNSVVEGRGDPVSLVLAGYSETQVEKSEVYRFLERDQVIRLEGGHDALGVELTPLNLKQARQNLLNQVEKVSAFAVSSMFGTRNTAHEIILRDLIIELTGKPVACGHELASSLGAPRRALTAALNARMILHIQRLIDSVEEILQRHAIQAPLMIVKGDGSLVNADTARLQPVATVLSGPAASVVGACALSGLKDGIVVDIGGTTTDIAIVTNGQPELCEDGAQIGDWQPMVEAIRVFSIGLGGDSEVRFRNGLAISPRRVVPISLLAHQHPEVVSRLERQWSAAPNPRNNRFALRLQQSDVLLAQLDNTEYDAWQLLQEGPVEMDELAERDRRMMRAIARLERLGLAIYSGFTPSDATHVLGLSDHWHRQAAELGARIWARQMRHLYGCGNWTIGDPMEPSRQVFELVVRAISEKLIEAGLNQHGKLLDSRSRNLTRLLADMILIPKEAGPAKPLFELRFAQNYPIIAVGGPAGDYFPEVGRMLDVALALPAHADTANAIGAVMGAVVQTSHITVTQPEFGLFLLFHQHAPLRFDNLEVALGRARELARAEAESLARRAGADRVETHVYDNMNRVSHDIDGEFFVSATVTAIASGRPGHLRHTTRCPEVPNQTITPSDKATVSDLCSSTS